MFVPLHHTTTIRMEHTAHGGWEFLCPECGYRSRYVRDSNHGHPALEILDIGDPQARHTSAPVPEALDNGWQTGFDGEEDSCLEGEAGLDQVSWLTPASQKRLEEILRGLD